MEAGNNDPPAALPGTPCPFLRAAINPDSESQTGAPAMTLGRAPLRDLYVHGHTQSGSRLFGVVLMGVGLISNGLGRKGLWRNVTSASFDSAGLTGGPLDKPRADTKILQGRGSGVFCADYFDKMLAEFGADFTPMNGERSERGLDLTGIRTMIRTNRKRDDGNALTTLAAYGEFIPLLWIYGALSREGPRYLPEAALVSLFRDMEFPAPRA